MPAGNCRNFSEDGHLAVVCGRPGTFSKQNRNAGRENGCGDTRRRRRNKRRQIERLRGPRPPAFVINSIKHRSWEKTRQNHATTTTTTWKYYSLECHLGPPSCNLRPWTSSRLSPSPVARRRMNAALLFRTGLSDSVH